MISNKLKVEIALIDIKELKPHERFIPGRVATILDSLFKSKVLRRPLIVDSKTFTVLDGTHRLEALRRLRIKVVPAILVDYEGSDEIIVDRWVRVYEIENSDEDEILREFKKAFRHSISIVGYNPLTIKIDESLRGEAYRILEVLEISPNITVRFRTAKPKRAPNSLIIIPPRLSKAEVVEAALNGRPFPPKSTRHVTVLKNIVLRMKLSNLNSVEPLLPSLTL